MEEASPDEVAQCVADILDRYNVSINKVENPVDKLKTIIELIVNLEHIHSFVDGNTRTSLLILNKELIKHGFSPVIMQDPNRLGGLSVAELHNEIVQGMRCFQQVKRGETAHLGMSTEKIKELITNGEKYSNCIKTQEVLDTITTNSQTILNKVSAMYA